MSDINKTGLSLKERVSNDININAEDEATAIQSGQVEVSGMKITGATLLSTEETETLLTQEERAYKEWWWLRSPGEYQYTAAIVDYDGSVVRNGLDVDYDNACVRPALKIDISNSDIKVGDVFELDSKEFKVISPELAWMHKDDIGCCAFREDYTAFDAAKYEASDVKEFVDAWYENIVLNINKNKEEMQIGDMPEMSIREKFEQIEKEKNKSHVNELTEINERCEKADMIAYEMINYVQENLINKPLGPDALLICQDATDKLENDGDVYAFWEHLNKIALTENNKIFLVETSYSNDEPEADIHKIDANELTKEFLKFNEPNIDSLIKLTKFIEENNLSPELTASRNSIPNDSNNGSHGGGYER